MAENVTFPLSATTGQTNFKVEPSCSLPHCPWLSHASCDSPNHNPSGCKGGSCACQPPEQDHFHKETSAPSESTRLPLTGRGLGSQPGLKRLSLSFCLVVRCLFLLPPREDWCQVNSLLTKSAPWLIGWHGEIVKNEREEDRRHVIKRQCSDMPF